MIVETPVNQYTCLRYAYDLPKSEKEMSIEIEIETLSNNKVYTVASSVLSYLYDLCLPEVENAINNTR